MWPTSSSSSGPTTCRPIPRDPFDPEESLSDIEMLVVAAARAAADKKAADILAIEVGPLLVVTDYFLIATGASDRQVGAIAGAVEDALRDLGSRPIGREGERELKWVLLDYGDFVVHVFQPTERAFYRLEKLWSDAPRLDLPADIDGVDGLADVGSGGSEDRTFDDADPLTELLGAEEDGGS
jgi:ribosome-associated protein